MKPYALYETDCYPDFAAMLHGVASKYGEATALTWYSRRGEPCSVSYQQLCRDAFRAAAVLHVLGLDGRHRCV